MKKVALGLAVAVALLGLVGPAAAQTAKAKKKTVAVMDLDYGTVTDRWWGDYDIGKGVADQIIDELVNDATFRVIERKKLDTVLAEQDFAQSDRADVSAAARTKMGKVLGVQYILAGSITKFGSEKKSTGGSFKGLGVGVGKAKTEVGLTVRVIDATTGEILISAKGIGVSKKGGGFAFGKGGTSFGTGSSEFRESAIGEAQAMACAEIVKAIIAKKDNLE